MKIFKAMKYCTQSGMVPCCSGYNGVGTMNVKTHSYYRTKIGDYFITRGCYYCSAWRYKYSIEQKSVKKWNVYRVRGLFLQNENNRYKIKSLL